MALNVEQGGLAFHPHHHYGLHGGLDAPALVPQQAGRRPAAPATMQRPPLPLPPTAAQHKPPAVNSCLTHSLQAGRHAAGAAMGPAGGAAQPMAMPACGAQAAPLPAPPLAPSLGFPLVQQPALPPAALYASSWHAAAYAQQQQQQQQVAMYSMAAGLPAGGAPAAACHPSVLAPAGHTVAAGWPTLQPHSGSYSLFQAQMSQAQAALSLLPQQQAGAAAGATATKRRTRRRPTARRSLLSLFDAAAASEEASEYDSMEDSDSECEVMQMCSQESAASSASLAAFPPSHSAARTPAPRTPFSQDQSSQASLTPPAPQPGREGCRSCSPSSADAPSTPQAAAADEHMLPLQHLLMSERARHLTALEVKAIVFKVATDLASLHDAGVLHRHVTIASVALARTGNLATARLMGHPYNVDAGQARRYTGGKKAGVDAYLAPELARCPSDCVAYTPAGDMWSLGVVLFVLLSGSHVPFGNRGLCWTSIPNMPGPQESVDKLQKWLEEHLACKVGVINQLRANQQKGKAPLGAGPEMRVVGVDDSACDLLMRLLAADPAARPTARKVLSHPWLAEVEALVSGSASKAPCAAHAAPCAAHAAHATQGQPRPPSPEELAAAGMSPGFEAQLRRTASELAHLGFSPATPCEDLAPMLPPLHRGSSDLSAASTDCHFECGSAGPSCNTSAHASCTDLTEAFAAAAPGGSVHGGRAATALQQAQQAQQAGPEQHPAPGAAAAREASVAFVLQDGTALQLLSHEAAAALVALGALPDLSAGSSCRSALPFPPLGFAVHPTGATVEGQSTPLSAIYLVYNVEGQAMLAAEPIAVTQLPGPGADSGRSVPRNPPTAAPTGGSRAAPAQRPPAPPAHVNPDLGTSAPILPLLARMLQQQQQ